MHETALHSEMREKNPQTQCYKWHCRSYLEIVLLQNRKVVDFASIDKDNLLPLNDPLYYPAWEVLLYLYVVYLIKTFWNFLAWYTVDSTKITEVNLSVFVYRLFHEDFFPITVDSLMFARLIWWVSFKRVHFSVTRLTIYFHMAA